MNTEMRDARGVPEEGFHEIQLSGKQLVFLFMATTVVSIVIFLCGVLVGRGVRQVPTAGQAATEATANTATDIGSDASTTAGPAARREAPPPLPAEDPTPAELNPEDLTYKERLDAAKAPTEVLKTPKPDQSAAARSPSPSKPPAAERAASTVSAAMPRAQDGRYVVQVAALRERSEAETIARRLSTRGYQAYVDASAGAGVRMYRVRVGAFKERRDADRIRLRLEKEEQFKPWVTTR
jgi:cell division septation protein DedD